MCSSSTTRVFRSNLILFFATSVIIFTSATSLVAEYSSVTLPVTLYGSTIHYDGLDTVYLVGGTHNEELSGDVIAYSISADTVQIVGAMPNIGFFGSVQQFEEDGNEFYYFGGYSDTTGDFSVVYKIEKMGEEELEITELAQLPVDVMYSTSVAINTSTVLIVGGQGMENGLLFFNLDTETGTVVDATLPMELPYVTSTQVGDDFYIFGDTRQSSDGGDAILILNLASMETSLRDVLGFPDVGYF
ncbi:uncharacterized protein LOC118435606 [Folsomia candida]|uniref:Ras guanine nucleotide exchange factor F n=1 Tax=Folsomia candida TaxID=158441 RepID=A0A226EAS7_FOLCA|nr:uncharacterized protein LOC118435606 [Folsomia candida]OXA54623.1 Ras guanine nucleotide exchange factor F [Folsomia candida]